MHSQQSHHLTNHVWDRVGRALLRVREEKIIPWAYGALGNNQPGEAVQVKAEGVILFEDEEMPVSIHLTTPPSCAMVPIFGDHMVITIARSNES